MEEISDREVAKIDEMSENALEFINNGEKDKGEKIIDRILSEFSEKQYAHSTVAEIYWDLKMYKEAKNIIKRYKIKTGKELEDKSTLELLEMDEKEYNNTIKETKCESGWIFKVEPVLDYLIKYGILKEISISKKGILLKGIMKTIEIGWGSINQAVIFEPSESEIGMDRFLLLKTDKKDIVLCEGYIKGGEVLFEEVLPKYIRVKRQSGSAKEKDVKIRKPWFFRYVITPLVVVAAIITRDTETIVIAVIVLALCLLGVFLEWDYKSLIKKNQRLKK